MPRSESPPLRVLPALITMLLCGTLAFTGLAAYFTLTRTPAAPDIAPALLLALAILGPAEFLTFKFILRPALLRQAAAATATLKSHDRDLALERHFFTATLIPAALAEGWGLFGAVILFLTGQWLAIAAPAIAIFIFAKLFNVRDGFERFKEEVGRIHNG